MLEVYEVFDASNEELLSELQNLQQLLRAAPGSNHVQYKMLYDTVKQELEERGVSNKVFQQLAPKAMLPSQPPSAPSLGLASPASSAAAQPSPQPAVIVRQPVAALYSFGSFGANSGSGGASAAAMPYSSHAHPHANSQMAPPGTNGGSSGIAQAVNAMVAATVRHGTPTSPTATSSGYGGGSGITRAQHAGPPAAAPMLSPSVSAVAHPLHRNHDLTPSSSGLGRQPQQQQQQQPPQLRPQPSSLQLPLQQVQPHHPASPSRVGADGDAGGGLLGLNSLGLDTDSESIADAGAMVSPSLPSPSMPGARGKHPPCGAEGSALSVASSNGVAAVEGAATDEAGNGGEAAAAGDGGKPLSVWEAAMKAFQEEQRLLRKARKAIRKGVPAKPPARKPSVLPIQPHHHSPQQPSAPAPLACEVSQAGSTRTGPARGSSCGSGNSPAGPGPGPGSGSGSGAGGRSGGAPSPHGATVLAAGSIVARAAASAAPTTAAAGAAAVNGSIGANGNNGGASSSSKAGGQGTGAAAAAATTRQVNGVAGPAGKAAAAAASTGSAAKVQPSPPATTATAASASGSAAGVLAAAETAAADADTVAEEQGLQARTQVEAGEAAGQQREASEPESVKTDEEASDLLAAAMREAADANATAAEVAARNSAAVNAAALSYDSEPESVSSGASETEEQRQQQQDPKRQQQQEHAGPTRAAPLETRPASAGAASCTSPGATPVRSSLPVLPVTARPTAAAVDPAPAGCSGALPAGSARAAVSAAAAAAPRSAWAAPQAYTDGQAPQREGAAEAETVATESEPGTESEGDNGYGSDGSGWPGSGGKGARSRGRSRAGAQNEQQKQQDEEAKRRAIAAAAAAAIQGRSAADPSSYVATGPPLERAIINSNPLRVDRWADWDLADSSDALSAWGTEAEQDPMLRGGGHLRTLRPMGQHAPPESLVTGPPGAHGLSVPVQQQNGTLQRLVGSAGGSGRRGSRQGEGGASRLESAAIGGRGSALAGSEQGGGGGGGNRASKSGSSDGEADACASDSGGGGGAAAGARGVRRPGRTTAALPQPPLAPSARPSNGPAQSAQGPSAAATATAASPARRPPLAPSAQPQQSPQPNTPPPAARSHSAGPSSAAASNARGPTPASAGAPNTSPSAAVPDAASPPATPYLQFFSAFHEILTLCYSALPVMLDAAALSSSSVATVAGGSGGSNSRPASRMVAAFGGAASGIDLLERYAGLLARCEAWQAKLRLLSQSAPEEDAASGAGSAASTRTATLGIVSGSAGAVTSTATSTSTPSSPHVVRATGDSGGACAGSGPPPPAARRYVAIIDDTAHPEVRNVVTAAVQLLSPSWSLDPADQVTEVAKPEPSPDDDAGGGTASAASSRPGTALPGPSAAATSRGASPGLLGGTTFLTSGFGSGFTPPGFGGTSIGGAGGGTSSGGAGPSSGSGGAAGAGSSGSRCHMWNVLWSWSVKVRVPVNELMVWQRVNHFAEARQLTRKDLLKKHLAKYQAMHNTGRAASLFDRLTPTTFVLPKEAAALEEAFVRALHGVEATCVQPMGLNLWIQKPVGLSRGRGISLISSLRKLNAGEPTVVQRYLTEPLLVEGFKFDLRLYVLVTSFNPLEAWMYEEGFARFTTLSYTLDEAELGNMHVHLTNSSVQRTRAEAGLLPAFLQSAEPAGGSKTSLATLRRLLARQGVEWSTLWGRVCEVATATLFAAQDAIPHSPNSFELFGFDMMIDAQLKVWLLEVNSSPSMGLDTPLDRAIKPRLIADVLELLAPLPFDREALAGVLRARANTGRSSRRGTSGLFSGTMSEERELLCTDLQAVLGGAVPRRYGERPRNSGGFTTCLAPSPFHDRLLKLRRPLPC